MFMLYIWNGKFLKAYSIIYFMLMVWACVLAESHIVGGGGNSDISLWSSGSSWAPLSTEHTLNMAFFSALLVCPWFASGYFLPKGTLFKILLTLHFIFGVLVFLAYSGNIFAFQFFGPNLTDYQMDFKEFPPAPVDKYASHFFAYYVGPIVLIYDIILLVFALIGTNRLNDKQQIIIPDANSDMGK